MRSIALVLALLTLASLAASSTYSYEASRAGENSAPRIGNIRLPYTVPLSEDSGLIWVELETLFTDPDDDSLEFLVRNEDDQWATSYDDGLLKAMIVNNGTKTDPIYVMSVRLQPDLSGEFVLRVNATDVNPDPLSVELDVHISVSQVNDAPILDRVGSYVIDPGMVRIDIETDQGKKIYIQPYAHDVDGDKLEFSWDIASALANPLDNVTYDFDPGSGQLWFRTSDSDVPDLITVLKVSDPGGKSDSVEVKVNVNNVNDPPFISVPPRKTTLEGESVYIYPVGGDVDIDSGDMVTYTYSLGKMTAVVPSNALQFDTGTGSLRIDAIDEKMNGEWEINITVTDIDMTTASGICKLIIQNQNDVPVAAAVHKNVLEKNLTVTFVTAAAKDEDGDPLMYHWDFGDGSEGLSGIDRRMVQHTYSKTGTYTASMYVSDGRSESERMTVTVPVQAPDPIPDKDMDGILDSWEERAGLDPTDPLDAELDTDEDGLTNLEEYEYNASHEGAYLNPNNPDTDGDGSSDGDEVRAGSDPLDINSAPEPQYKDIATVLIVLGTVLIGFAMVLLVVMIVIKVRNKRAMRYIAAPPVAPQYGGYIGGPPIYQYTAPSPLSVISPAPVEYAQPGPAVSYPYQEPPAYQAPIVEAQPPVDVFPLTQVADPSSDASAYQGPPLETPPVPQPPPIPDLPLSPPMVPPSQQPQGTAENH